MIPTDKVVDIQMELNFKSNHFDLILHTTRSNNSAPTRSQTKAILGTTGQGEIHTDQNNKKTTKTLNHNDRHLHQSRNVIPDIGDYSSHTDEYKQKEQGQEIVINISSKQLTEDEIRILAKGEKFIPINKRIDFSKLLSDLKEWERRMRLREYFYERDDSETRLEDNEDHDVYKKKKNSIFTPASGRDRWLDTYIDVVREDVIRGLKRNVKQNITQHEQKALYDLLKDDSIMIWPADKGSGIVVMDTDRYTAEIKAELADPETYITLDSDPTKGIQYKTKTFINEMYRNGSISKDLQQYLTPDEASPGQVKGNPKVHKKGNPMRLIVSGIGTATERIAEVAERELTEYVINTPSYLRDTTNFLNEIDQIGELPDDTILFCFDVEKLYPSIPRKEGLEECLVALQSRSKKSIPDDDVWNMIKMVLENNHFEFNHKHYLQVDGTAIGSRLGKNYACTYMRQWNCFKALDLFNSI